MSNVDLTSFTTKPIAQAEVREQPHNIEAEQGLLGAILINNRAFEKVSDFLQAEHFSDPVHGQIFDCLLYTSPSPRDLSTSRMPSSA